MGVGVGVGVGSGVGHLLTRARAALHSRLPPKKRTRSRAPAQHCLHACYLAHTRSRATNGAGSWGGVGGGGGVGVGWGGAQPPTRSAAHGWLLERRGRPSQSHLAANATKFHTT